MGNYRNVYKNAFNIRSRMENIMKGRDGITAKLQSNLKPAKKLDLRQRLTKMDAKITDWERELAVLEAEIERVETHFMSQHGMDIHGRCSLQTHNTKEACDEARKNGAKCQWIHL